MRKKLDSPVGLIGVFKPVYLDTVNKLDERDGMYCKILEAEFWKTDEGEDYGELLVEFLESLERLTIGVNEIEIA